MYLFLLLDRWPLLVCVLRLGLWVLFTWFAFDDFVWLVVLFFVELLVSKWWWVVLFACAWGFWGV